MICVLYPIKDITKVPFSGTSMEKLPSISDTVPLVVPCRVMVAPGNGAPVSSTTVPLRSAITIFSSATAAAEIGRTRITKKRSGANTQIIE